MIIKCWWRLVVIVLYFPMMYFFLFFFYIKRFWTVSSLDKKCSCTLTVRWMSRVKCFMETHFTMSFIFLIVWVAHECQHVHTFAFLILWVALVCQSCPVHWNTVSRGVKLILVTFHILLMVFLGGLSWLWTHINVSSLYIIAYTQQIDEKLVLKCQKIHFFVFLLKGEWSPKILQSLISQCR